MEEEDKKVLEKTKLIVNIIVALIELILAITLFMKANEAINADVKPICECKVDKGVASCLCKKE